MTKLAGRREDGVAEICTEDASQHAPAAPQVQQDARGLASAAAQQHPAQEADESADESEDSDEAYDAWSGAPVRLDRYTSDKHAYESICQRDLRRFLQQAKGMSRSAATAFVRDHFTIRVQSCRFEDWNEEKLRSVEATVTFSHTVPHRDDNNGSVEVPVSFTATLSFHGLALYVGHEHHAHLTYTAKGPDTAATASGKVLSSCVHPGVELANLNLGLATGEHQVRHVERKRFRLSRNGARALQAVCGPGWTMHEAVVLLYAAVGLPYSDKHLECSGLCYPLFYEKPDWLERHTRQVCKVADTGSDSDGYETDDSDEALEEAVDRAKDSVADGDGRDGERMVYEMNKRARDDPGSGVNERTLPMWKQMTSGGRVDAYGWPAMW